MSAGLDPHLGVLHADEYARPVLAYDLIEPFRPFAERLVIGLILDGAVDVGDLQPHEGGFWLGKNGKKVLITSFNDLLRTETRWRGARLTWQSHIFKHCTGLASLLREEMPE